MNERLGPNPLEILGANKTLVERFPDVNQLQKILQSLYRIQQQFVHPDHAGTEEISKALNVAWEKVQDDQQIKAYREALLQTSPEIKMQTRMGIETLKSKIIQLQKEGESNKKLLRNYKKQSEQLAQEKQKLEEMIFNQHQVLIEPSNRLSPQDAINKYWLKFSQIQLSAHQKNTLNLFICLDEELNPILGRRPKEKGPILSTNKKLVDTEKIFFIGSLSEPTQNLTNKYDSEGFRQFLPYLEPFIEVGKQAVFLYKKEEVMDFTGKNLIIKGYYITGNLKEIIPKT